MVGWIPPIMMFSPVSMTQFVGRAVPAENPKERVAPMKMRLLNERAENLHLCENGQILFRVDE